jgi:inorganic pyrophosphatase
MSGTGFFEVLDGLLRSSELVIDRRKGTVHPRIPEIVYPLDYGYLAGTTSGDGDGIDVFVGTAPEAGLVGLLLTADPVKRDAEIKLLVDCSDDEVEIARAFLADHLEIGGHLVRR